ncbi:MAG: hypothetical protein IT288_14145 [Bdellovibrionales bacterium]|nr:hypothetical protein [Bdellovibrionales bacterium]
MNIFYDVELDYAEIFFSRAPNYGDELMPGILAFKRESDNEVIGYAFDQASRSVFEFANLPTRAKVAFLLKFTREQKGYTQDDVIQQMSRGSGRQYQRAEAGENISLDFVDEIRRALPEADFSKVFRAKNASA